MLREKWLQQAPKHKLYQVVPVLRCSSSSYIRNMRTSMLLKNTLIWPSKEQLPCMKVIVFLVSRRLTCSSISCNLNLTSFANQHLSWSKTSMHSLSKLLDHLLRESSWDVLRFVQRLWISFALFYKQSVITQEKLSKLSLMQNKTTFSQTMTIIKCLVLLLCLQMMDKDNPSNNKSMQMECQFKVRINKDHHNLIDKQELISSLKKLELELTPISRLSSEQSEKLFQSWLVTSW